LAKLGPNFLLFYARFQKVPLIPKDYVLLGGLLKLSGGQDYTPQRWWVDWGPL